MFRSRCAISGGGSILPGSLDMAVAQDSVIGVGHIVADDHLILTTRLQHLDDAPDLAQPFGICFGLILQLKAQTGHAVSQ